MGSVTYNGPVPEDEPRYKEGFAIKAFNKKSKYNDSAEDQKLLEYLPESSREHELIGKWLSLMQDRENGNLPIDNNCFNNVNAYSIKIIIWYYYISMFFSVFNKLFMHGF